jgi:hypothetical protein
MTREQSEIIWQCLLNEVGLGEGLVVAEALQRSAIELGLSPEAGMEVYDNLPLRPTKDITNR